MKGIQVCSNKVPRPLQMGGNHKNTTRGPGVTISLTWVKKANSSTNFPYCNLTLPLGAMVFLHFKKKLLCKLYFSGAEVLEKICFIILPIKTHKNGFPYLLWSQSPLPEPRLLNLDFALH
jgi:hypothetical protein